VYVPGSVQDEWKGVNVKKRHLVIRASVHGFHKICVLGMEEHERTNECVCLLCGRVCEELLHVVECEVVGMYGLSFLDTV